MSQVETRLAKKAALAEKKENNDFNLHENFIIRDSPKKAVFSRGKRSFVAMRNLQGKLVLIIVFHNLYGHGRRKKNAKSDNSRMRLNSILGIE